MKGGSILRRKQVHKSSGFTIVEVLIVLAVTGAMFFSALAVLGSRIARTEFTQALTDMQAQIQQTINDTANGYYPNIANFQCTKSPTGTISIAAGTTEQGANRDCTFIGKVMQFKVDATDPEQYITYPIVGLRCASTAGGDICEPPTIAEAKPAALVKPAVDASTTKTLLNGLKTQYVRYGSSNIAAGAVGFIADPSTLAASANGQAAGIQATDVYVINGSALNETKNIAVSKIDATNSLVKAEGGVRICFVSGGTNQSGLLTIGGTKGLSTAVTVRVFENTSCT